MNRDTFFSGANAIYSSVANLWSENDNNWLPYFAVGGNQLCEDVPDCVADSDNFEISLEQFYYSFPIEALQDCDGL